MSPPPPPSTLFPYTTLFRSDLCDPVTRVVRVACRRVVVVRDERSAVQGIVGRGRDLALPVGESREVAVVVIDIALGAEQRVRPRRLTVYVVVDRGRGVRARVGHAQQIAVLVIAELREACERVGDLRHSV